MIVSNRPDNIYTGPLVNSDENILRQVYRFIKRSIVCDCLLYPYARYKHRKLAKSVQKKDHHTYTSFYRSPGQLEALVGPVLEHVFHRRKLDHLTIDVFAGSSGAEAYTMASVLMRTFPELDFHINCSDLHEDILDKARAGQFTWTQITQGFPLPQKFIDETFDQVSDEYTIKPAIRSHVTFSRADIINDNLSEMFEPADIVCAQNVFCHLENRDAETAFANIMSLAKERSAIFIDGTAPDLRIKITSSYGLEPLNFKVREIYDNSRRRLSPAWWNYYYGREPFFFFRKNRLRRYGTIFLR